MVRLSSRPAIAGLPGKTGAADWAFGAPGFQRDHPNDHLDDPAPTGTCRDRRRYPREQGGSDQNRPVRGDQRPTDLATGSCARDAPCVTLPSSLCCDEPLVTLAGDPCDVSIVTLQEAA